MTARPGEEGSDLLSVMKALNDTGTVLEVFCPFSQYRAGSLAFPNEIHGYRYKAGNYARCTSVQEIKEALALGKPVALGIQCTPEIYEVERDLPYVPLPDKLLLIGGHAVAVVGYNDNLSHDGHTGHLLIKTAGARTGATAGTAGCPTTMWTTAQRDTGLRALFMDAYCCVDLENDGPDGAGSQTDHWR